MKTLKPTGVYDYSGAFSGYRHNAAAQVSVALENACLSLRVSRFLLQLRSGWLYGRSGSQAVYSSRGLGSRAGTFLWTSIIVLTFARVHGPMQHEASVSGTRSEFHGQRMHDHVA